MAYRACWTCTRNCSGVSFDQTGTHNSTLWGRVKFSVLVLDSTASWRISFLGIYGIRGLLLPTFLSHSWGLSPSGATFAWLILAAAAPRLVHKKRALTKLFGAWLMGTKKYWLDKRSTWTACKLSFVFDGCRTWHDGGHWMVGNAWWRLRNGVKKIILLVRCQKNLFELSSKNCFGRASKNVVWTAIQKMFWLGIKKCCLNCRSKTFLFDVKKHRLSCPDKSYPYDLKVAIARGGHAIGYRSIVS